MHAEVGGFKEVNDWNTNRLKNVTYTSLINDYYEFFELTFDYVPPQHCTELNNCGANVDPGADPEREIISAVSPGQEITKVTRVYMTQCC